MVRPIDRPVDNGLIEQVVARLRALFPHNGFIALHEPEFAGNEWAYVKECLDTGWVSSVGKFVDEFEVQLAAFTGARHAVVTVNGTAALHVALLLAGVRNADEVLVPALSFVATANAVAHAGAIPHFVDSDTISFGMDAGLLATYLRHIVEPHSGAAMNRKTGRRIAAMVPMHVFGHPADMEGLLKVSRDFAIPLVEDAAESLGSYYHGRHTGTFGLCGVLSFNGNKVLTTGGGGAILTDDRDLAVQAKHLTTTAKRPHAWEFFHDQVAWNYRMPNLNAALGVAQLERLPSMLERKRRLAEVYRAAFSDLPGLRFVDQPAGCMSNFWLNAIMLDKADVRVRNGLLEALNSEGIMARPVWTLLNRLPMYRASPTADLTNAERLEASIINIPSSASLMARGET